MTTNASLRKRVEMLESEIANIKQQLKRVPELQTSWVDAIAGTFANDPIYEEAMRLGREYRESLRPKPRKRVKRKA